MTRGKGSPCGGKKRQRRRFLVTLTVASDAGMDERQRGEVGCLRHAWKGRKGGEKGAAASGWLSPFILVWRGGAGTGGGGRYGGGATHRGFGEWPGVVVGRRRGPTTILSERQSQVVGRPRGSTG
jgi:hypothetical protein